MSDNPNLLTISELRKQFSYDPVTGYIHSIGYGTILSKSGYVKVGSRLITKCKLAYALHFGRWAWFNVLPADGDHCNTKLSNLQEQVPRTKVLAPSSLPPGVRRIDDLDKYLERRIKK